MPALASELFIDQRYQAYTPENHEAWRKLYARLKPRWDVYANDRFLNGIEALGLNGDRVPRLEDINRVLAPRTGFQAKAVSGYVPAFLFFDCLRNREFPTTITIRRSDQLDYLPEPDIFHDVAGHVPMHTDRRFAETLVRLGECAHTAAARVAAMPEPVRLRTLTSIVRAMARFFWFTIEFGLMKGRGGLRAYGPKPEVGIQFGAGGASAAEELEAEGTRDPSWAIHQAKRLLDAGAEIIMVESEGITENVKALRSDVVAKFAGELGSSI